eukprot:3005459-Ditylum_brightwellii.AAC.1
MIVKKVDRQAIVDEMKLHEDAMIEEILEKFESDGHQREEATRQREELMPNQMKTLHIELFVVTLACIGISFVALLHLKKLKF